MSTPKGQGFIYKAAGDKGKRGVFLTPQGGSRTPPVAVLPDGTKITGKYINTNEGRHQFLFGNDILGQKDVKIIYDGDEGVLPDGNLSYETDSISGGFKYRAKGDLAGGGAGGSGGVPIGAGGANFGGGVDNAGNAIPTNTDASSLQAGQSEVGPLEIPPYIPIDPKTYAQMYAAYNREEIAKNLADAQNDALSLIGTESQGNRQFAPDAAALQQGIASQENNFNRGEIATSNQFNPTQVSDANAFNKQSFNDAIDSSGLNIRSTITGRLEDSSRMAKGFLPTSLEDRAFEMAARSTAGDSLQARGLGTSAFTQNAIDKYTIGERLNLMQQGNQQVDQWLSKGAALLIDSPIKYNPLLQQPNSGKVSQDIRGLPSLSGSQLAGSQFGTRNSLTTMTPSQALSNSIQQDQFKTNTDLDLGKFNKTNEIQQGQFNITNNLNVDIAKLNNDAQIARANYLYAQEAVARARAERTQQRARQANNIGASTQGNQQTTTAPDGTTTITTSGF